MKRHIVVLVTVLTIVALLVGGSVVMAAKPTENGAGKNVIEHSNGFPSGQHLTLNLHGRDCSWDGTPTGNVIIVPLYSDDAACTKNATIEYLSNKKRSSHDDTELVVLDALTENFDNDAAQVWLPYYTVNETDNTTIPAGGYFVFGRSLGKPNNAKDGTESRFLIYPNNIVAADNITDNETWPWPYPEDGTNALLDLGLLYNGQAYKTEGDEFLRFDPTAGDSSTGNKRGKSTAVEITDLFLWSGYYTSNFSIDLNSDNVLNELDYEKDKADNITSCNASIDFDAWLACQAEAGRLIYKEWVWIFDIAEMMITGQEVENDGTRNFQIRFYPVATTTFREFGPEPPPEP